MQQKQKSNPLEALLVRFPVIVQLLRFAAIGVINTALDFAVFNYLSKSFGITAGSKLGWINVIGFSLAVVQSYLWNKYWTFSTGSKVGLFKNALRLFLVGALGTGVVAMVVAGSKFEVSAQYYLIALAVLIIGELIIWYSQGINRASVKSNTSAQFVGFVVVSIIGLGINSGLVSVLSENLITAEAFANDPELVKNVAKIIATLASLVWNFIGYKLFVFKR